MTSIPEQWVERAQYDLETARAMLASGRLLYVLFCCQQAVEKMLKGIIAKRTESLPPRLHNLVRLSEYAGLELSEERLRLFENLSKYYIQTRYPEGMDSLSKGLSKDDSQNLFDETEDALSWLSSMI